MRMAPCTAYWYSVMGLRSLRPPKPRPAKLASLRQHIARHCHLPYSAMPSRRWFPKSERPRMMEEYVTSAALPLLQAPESPAPRVKAQYTPRRAALPPYNHFDAPCFALHKYFCFLASSRKPFPIPSVPIPFPCLVFEISYSSPNGVPNTARIADLRVHTHINVFVLHL